MPKPFLAFVILAFVTLAGQALAGQAPAMKDRQIASRALTGADLEKYVAIPARVTQANKDRKGDMSQAAMQAKKARACEEHGWTTTDYGVVDARVGYQGQPVCGRPGVIRSAFL